MRMKELSVERMDGIRFPQGWVEHEPYKTMDVKVMLLFFLVFKGYEIFIRMERCSDPNN
jgi:hypothetical protein